MDTNQEIIDLAYEIMELEHLPLAVALDAAALALDDAEAFAARWDAAAQAQQRDELQAFAAAWDEAVQAARAA